MKFREIEEPASDLGREASGVDNRICLDKRLWAKDEFLTSPIGAVCPEKRLNERIRNI